MADEQRLCLWKMCHSGLPQSLCSGIQTETLTYSIDMCVYCQLLSGLLFCYYLLLDNEASKELKQPGWKSKHCLSDCELDNFVNGDHAFAWMLDEAVEFPKPVDVGLKFQVFRNLPEECVRLDSQHHSMRKKCFPSSEDTVLGLVHAEAALIA